MMLTLPLLASPAAGAMLPALLAAFRLRLLRLPDAAAVRLIRRRADLAHVIPILHHVLAAEAVGS
jgi:hypothetical protein